MTPCSPSRPRKSSPSKRRGAGIPARHSLRGRSRPGRPCHGERIRDEKVRVHAVGGVSPAGGRLPAGPAAGCRRAGRAAGPAHRSGGDERPDHVPGRGGVRSAHHLRRVGGRGSLEVDGRWRPFPAHLRRPRDVDRRHPHRPLRSAAGLGGGGRKLDPQHRLGGRRGLPQHGRGQDLAAQGTVRQRADRPHRRASHRLEDRLRLCHRAPLGLQRGAGRLPDE